MLPLQQLITNAPVLRYFDPTIAFGAQGLTQTERNYAQIEKMLAIVCGCEKFDQFAYGRRVTVETDHKPLVSIALKPIHNSPKRLQRMHKRGSEMFLADAISRAYPTESVPVASPQSEFCHSVEAVDLTKHLPISSRRLKQATNKDSTLQTLKQHILLGWPNDKTQVPLEIRPYVKCHDELSIQDGILFKGSRITTEERIDSKGT